MNEAIETDRLVLAPITSEHIAAFFRNRSELSSLLGAKIPDDWPVCPESMDYWREKGGKLLQEGGWAGYFFIHRKDNQVVGDGGFKGPPDKGGLMEIGYSLIPDYRKRGLATEAASALIKWSFEHPEVTYVTAETLPEANDSMRVLEKLGMVYQGVHTDTKEGTVYLWRLSRDEYNFPRQPPEAEGCPL